ncbi:ATP-binding protein [bacterium]|nr:ATP-binding protein [bacterium]HPF36913.1 ATP-binding protein [Candidatus Krumholzibacteria bacterium]
MDELTNPFRPGAGTLPPALIGRDGLIDRFGVIARRTLDCRPGKSLMPIGLRGVGKTVLLNRFAEIATHEGFKVAFIEASENSTFATLLAVRLRSILLGLSSGKVSRAVNQALKVLRSFTLTLPDGQSIRIDVEPAFGLADSTMLGDDMTDLLIAVGEAAKSRGTAILIAIDEVQYLAAEEFSAVIVAIHRITQLNLPIVLVGAGLPQLPKLAGEAKSYSERLFEFPAIGALTPEESRIALLEPAQSEGADVEDEALDLMIRQSSGYPYFLQVWGYHAWNTAASETIATADVQAAEPFVVADLDSNFFRVRLDRLTPKEREYLYAMARLGPGPHRSGDIANMLGVKVESVAPRRSALINKGMIFSPAHGDTAFTVPLFDQFLLRAL